MVGFWNCSDKNFPKPLFSHRYWTRLTHPLQLMGLIHTGKAACKKLKRWFIANCLLWSSFCVDAECTIAGRVLPYLPRQDTSPCVYPEDEVPPSVCVQLSTKLIPGEQVPAGTCQSCTPSEVSSSSYFNTRAVQMGRCQGQGEPLLSSVVSNWVKRSLIVRLDSNHLPVLTLHFLFQIYDKE